MADVVSLCNLALLSIGSRSQISSLTENNTESNACSTLFSFVYEHLARTAKWNCLRKQATLSLLKAAQGTPENPSGTSMPLPPTPWLYSYVHPSDCLAVRFISPSLPSTTSNSNLSFTTFNNQAPITMPTGGAIPFVVAYDTDTSNNPIQVILTNQDVAQVVYTVNQPNPIIWDSMFQSAFVASLAAYLVPALSLNMPLMNLSIQKAEKLIEQARVADGDEGVTTQNREASWITARGYPSGWMSNAYQNSYPQYGGMIWPAGAGGGY